MSSIKVILSKDIPSLGEEGDVKSVKRGYARNYLFPKGLAVVCSKRNLQEIESKKEYFEKRKLEKIEYANKLKEKLETKKVKVSVSAGEKGRLFGTVTALNIAEELSKDEELKNIGFVVDRKQIELTDHIKFQGVYKYRIHLYKDIYANMELTVEAIVEKEKDEKGKKRFNKDRKGRYDKNREAKSSVDSEKDDSSENVSNEENNE